MDIRDATIDDLDSITSMINKMYDELKYGVQFSVDFVKARIKSRFFIIKVIEDKNHLIGFSTIKITKDEYSSKEDSSMGFLYELFIEIPYRKLGYAKSLLKEMEAELLDFGINYIELYVNINNDNGYDFWSNNDYKDKYMVLCKDIPNV